MTLFSAEDLRGTVRDALEATIDSRRSALAEYSGSDPSTAPVEDFEVDEFLAANPLFDSWVYDFLSEPGLLGFSNKRADVSDEAYEEFEEALSWVNVQDWYAGDDTIGAVNVVVRQGYQTFDEPDRHSIIRPAAGYSGHFSTSPALIALGQQLVQRGNSLHDLDPRQFEELVADLLDRDGWKVLLTPRSRDGGVDVIAERSDPVLGLIRTVWEAKRYHPQTNKVGVSTIRELSASVEDNRGTKGVLVTTGVLTRGALEYVEERKHRLAAAEFRKVEDWLFGRVRVG